MTMTLSKAGEKLIHSFEGCHLYWYDLKDGGLTCGYGHYITYATANKLGIKANDKITQKQADEYFRQDMKKFIDYTNHYVKQYGFAGKLNQNQFDALVSYCYNRGPGGLRELLKNSRTVKEIGNNLTIYWGTNLKYKNGLLNRRKKEQEYFFKKVDSQTQKNSTSTKTTSNKVKIKSSAKKYVTGQPIPAWVKNQKYTILQTKSDKVLLKEIMSWVYKKDIKYVK